eukprot:7889538-Pyramimonas_sp.AAC.2
MPPFICVSISGALEGFQSDIMGLEASVIPHLLDGPIAEHSARESNVPSMIPGPTCLRHEAGRTVQQGRSELPPESPEQHMQWLVAVNPCHAQAYLSHFVGAEATRRPFDVLDSVVCQWNDQRALHEHMFQIAAARYQSESASMTDHTEASPRYIEHCAARLQRMVSARPPKNRRVLLAGAGCQGNAIPSAGTGACARAARRGAARDAFSPQPATRDQLS